MEVKRNLSITIIFTEEEVLALYPHLQEKYVSQVMRDFKACLRTAMQLSDEELNPREVY